ncbi:MAG: hypothetical protein IJ634_02195 [Bacteroidales bacterium]|nr:hypothetical protein [Bacteroidales bacterium]
MKKILAILAVMATVSLVGCSKSKDCNCTVTQNIPGMGPQTTEMVYTADDGDCSGLNATTTSTVAGQTITQTIKCD